MFRFLILNIIIFLHFFKEISRIKRKEALQAHTSQQVCYVQPLEVG